MLSPLLKQTVYEGVAD
jgi:hypothetical protein